MIVENKNSGSKILNNPPNKMKLEIALQRTEINYENLFQKFTCSKKDFKRQFAHIYAGRLEKMKERVTGAASEKWGSQIPIRKLSELSDENDEKCVVVGTLFKHQELKPSVLKEISEENQIMPQPFRKNYVSDNDQLILEDEVQRIRLVGDFNIKKLVTGIVVALLGFENQQGKFEVEDMCFAAIDIGPENPLIVDDDCYILMVSGLSIGSMENMLALDLLVDWIKGQLGSVSDQEKAAKISRVLIAGNSVIEHHTTSSSKVINTEIEERLDTLSAVKQLDDILLELVNSVEVDIMPGEFDPSNHIMPQQAMLNCVFPKSSPYESFHCVTNPYEFIIGGRRILGTSGQPINDIISLTDITESIEVLENTLYWGHMAPTAPDTLACYPFYQDDPFIISHHPDIYFTGNQPKLSTKLLNIEGRLVRLICIPSFCKTQTCAIVNLKTLECTPLTFELSI